MKLISQTFIDYQTKFYNSDVLENYKKVFARKLVECIDLTYFIFFLFSEIKIWIFIKKCLISRVLLAWSLL